MPRETRGEALSRCEVMLAGAKKNVQELLFQFELALNAAKEAGAGCGVGGGFDSHALPPLALFGKSPVQRGT